MTEDPQQQPAPESSGGTLPEDPIEKLRSEFQEHFTTLKNSFEEENKKNLETITKLTKENEDLHRALIRSAQMPAQEVTKPKSDEEIYKEKIAELSKKSIAYEKMQRGIKT